MIFDFRFMLLVLLVMNRLRCFTGIVFLLVLTLYADAQNNYRLHYFFSDKDTSFRPESLGLQTFFTDQPACRQYIGEAVRELHKRGFIAASADSMIFDSTEGRIWMFVGVAYRWVGLHTDSTDQKMLAAIGWNDKLFKDVPLDMSRLSYWQERILNYYENNGHPFARVELDSILIEEGAAVGRLKIAKGPSYKIDSIRVYGNLKISNAFLQRYLGIENGSYYRKARLQAISARLLELPYLKEIKTWDMTMTGSGAVVNLYVDTRKSSQVDVLVGFLPAAQGTGRTKLQLTGEANINLKNALGSGETLGVNWQQIQVKSPRLHLKYEHPFMFKSPLGLDFNFDLLKKDSSFINLNTQIGIQYVTTGRKSGSVFFQNIITNVLADGMDTAKIKLSKRLPPYIDANTSNIGIRYSYNNTDYRFNPRRGNEFAVVAAAGLRKIRPNTAITGITKDGSGADFDFSRLYDTLDLRTYQLKLNVTGTHYFKTGRQSVLKTSANSGWMYSANIFKNELYQIGGYKLLRGFDEESIYASRYAVISAEYRFFIGLNSYFFGFADGGWVQNTAFGETEKQEHSYLGMGIGMAFETRAGIFNLSYAIGKRDDMPVNFRQSKIHFGLVSLF